MARHAHDQPAVRERLRRSDGRGRERVSPGDASTWSAMPTIFGVTRNLASSRRNPVERSRGLSPSARVPRHSTEAALVQWGVSDSMAVGKFPEGLNLGAEHTFQSRRPTGGTFE